VAPLQTALRQGIQLYRSLEACIVQADRESALLLARTPAAMLTTMKGTGITLAAGAGAEIGDPAQQPSLRRLASYAGIVPRVKQTGGPGGEARFLGVSRRCNHLLKNHLVQCGNHLGQHGPDELKEDHRRRGAQGQHADFGMARRYLRIGMRLMRTLQCYIPEDLRDRSDADELRMYYLTMWPRLRSVWKKAGALEVAFDTANPLGQWRECVQAVYGIELPL
jgi:transposase